MEYQSFHPRFKTLTELRMLVKIDAENVYFPLQIVIALLLYQAPQAHLDSQVHLVLTEMGLVLRV